MKTRDMGGHVLAGGRGGGRNLGVERAFFVENVSGSSRMLGFGSGEDIIDDVDDLVGTGIAPRFWQSLYCNRPVWTCGTLS